MAEYLHRHDFPVAWTDNSPGFQRFTSEDSLGIHLECLELKLNTTVGETRQSLILPCGRALLSHFGLLRCEE